VLELKPLWYPRKGHALVAQWIECLASNQVVGGSNPSWGTMGETYTQIVGHFGTGVAWNSAIVTLTSHPVGSFANGQQRFAKLT
jgi:hypothetical protein